MMRSSALRPMARGQAEALVPLLQEVLGDAGHDVQEITAIGVGIGPGNFTGTRISVATARGLALSLGVPAIGVSTFDLRRDPYGPGAHPAEIVSVEAPRDRAYVQHFRYGKPQSPPRMIDPSFPPEDLRFPVNMRVTGHRAAEIAAPFEAQHGDEVHGTLPWRLGKMTAYRWFEGVDDTRPAPLYVKAADAAVPSDPPPRILP